MNTNQPEVDQLESFTMDGWFYYRQARRCSSRRSCVTCEAGGEHGPYWYRRSPHHRDVQYVGATLPALISEAYSRVQHAAPEATRQIRSLEAQIADLKAQTKALESQVAALEALKQHDQLTDQQRTIIVACGLEAALPPIISIESRKEKQARAAKEAQLALVPADT